MKFGTAGKAIALLVLVAVAGAAFLAWKRGSDRDVRAPAQIEDYLFWQTKTLSDFQLKRAGNVTLGLGDLSGKWTFLFFGYTHCPDICPVTLAVLGQAFRIIDQTPELASEAQGLFISVDPGRDTPELLADYAAFFDKRLIGATGSVAQLDAISRQIGVFYTIQQPEAGRPADSYQVTHSSTIFLVDPQGRLYAKFPPPHDAQEMARAFRMIHAFHNERSGKKWLFF
jgi:protein SCO1/2